MLFWVDRIFFKRIEDSLKALFGQNFPRKVCSKIKNLKKQTRLTKLHFKGTSVHEIS